MSGEEEGREKENGGSSRVSLMVLCESARSAPITVLELIKQWLEIHQSEVRKISWSQNAWRLVSASFEVSS